MSTDSFPISDPGSLFFEDKVEKPRIAIFLFPVTILVSKDRDYFTPKIIQLGIDELSVFV